MRAPSNPILLVIAALGLAVAGCASQPKEEQTSRAVNQPECAQDPSNPLHLTTLRKKKEEPHDPQLESLLTEGGGPRLEQINREMYQTLRSLDAELRREQQIAACKRGATDIQSLQAQTTPNEGSGQGVGNAGNSAIGAVAVGGSNAGGIGGAGGTAGGGSAGAGGFVSDGTTVAGSNTGAAASAGSAATATSSAGLSGAGAAAPNARTTLIRKASVSPTTSAGGGNGATAQKVSPGSDNDIVARRLRKAAEQETNPALKAKLWKEYAQYEQGMATK